MRHTGYAALVVFIAACGGSSPADLCDSPNPPVECTIMCDPQPGAPNTCPIGFHCTPDGFCGQQCTQGGGECGDNAECSTDGTCIPEGPCQNLECFQVDCASMGGGTTSLSGTVFAPNGTIPLSGVTVYVPNSAVQPFGTDLSCDRCSSVLSGDPLVQATTDTFGRFTLTDVPATTNVPLVIQVGRWRRQLSIGDVPACVDTPVDAAQSRFPRNKGEGDIPRMALTTGDADALECLIRKIGLDDSEITTPSGTGRLHMFTGNGTDKFDGAHGNMAFPDAQTLWSDVPSLSNYDVVFLSCEGAQNEGTKPQSSLASLKSYADMGGRVFASHWHNIWLERSPPWTTPTITRVDNGDLGNIVADVDQSYSRGAELAQWLVNVSASTILGKISLEMAKHTVSDIISDAQRWIYLDNTGNGSPSIQYMSFTTPLEQAPEQRCGRVVFSDIHVAADDSSPAYEYPSGGCTTDVNTLTPQEKVLLFMIFDIASCIPVVVD